MPRLSIIPMRNDESYRLTRNYYGTQGIFVHAAVFQQLDGSKDLGITEDLDFSVPVEYVATSIRLWPPAPSWSAESGGLCGVSAER
jgi:hypothetical protein